MKSLPNYLTALAAATLLIGCSPTTPETKPAAPAPAPAPAAVAAPVVAPVVVAPAAPVAPVAPVVAVAPAVNVTGNWEWTCCDGHYAGALELTQAADKLTGRLHDGGDTEGHEVTGTIVGNVVKLTRTWTDYEQQYELTLSADGKKLAGELSGTRDENVGTHFEATRK
jgi:hypothetical protein